MPFFQNPFQQEFIGNWVLADRQFSPMFRVAANRNSSILMSNINGPYDLSGGGSNNQFTINVSINSGAIWTPITVTITAGSLAATTAAEVVASMQLNTTFSAYFDSFVETIDNYNTTFINLKAKYQRENFKAYINNTNAEAKLKFNKFTGINEIPTYFARHTISNIGTFADCAGLLVQLDTSNSYQAALIDAAGFDHTAAKADYQLLTGRSGLFTFVKNTLDGSARVATRIEYAAGAGVGDFSKKTTYAYTSTNTTPDKVTEVPYTLTSGDLVVP